MNCLGHMKRLSEHSFLCKNHQRPHLDGESSSEESVVSKKIKLRTKDIYEVDKDYLEKKFPDIFSDGKKL